MEEEPERIQNVQPSIFRRTIQSLDGGINDIASKHTMCLAASLIALNVLAVISIVGAYTLWQNSLATTASIGFALAFLCDILMGRYLKKYKRTWHMAAILALLVLPVGLSFSQTFMLWNIGAGDQLAFSSLVPNGDAGYCYQSANGIIEKGTFDEFAHRSPIGPIWYSLWLKLAAGSLKHSLLLNAALVGLGISCVSIAIASCLGISAGIAMAIGLFLFAREFSALILPETPCFLFGCLGFSLVVIGVAGIRKWTFVFGTFLVAFAMGIRPGSLAILPMLVVSGMFIFRKRTRAWMLCACLTGVIALGWTSGPILMKCTQPNWKNVSAHNHKVPDLARSDVTEVGQAKWPAIVSSVKLFLYSVRYPLTFFPFLKSMIDDRVILLLLGVALAWLLLPGQKEPNLVFLTCACILGITLSEAIILDNGFRVHAAAIPFFLLLFAVAIGSFIQTAVGEADPPRAAFSIPIVTVSTILLAGILFCPFFLEIAAPFARSSPSSCLPSERTVVFRASRGSFLHVVSDTCKSLVPDVRIGTAVRTWSWMPGASSVRVGDYFGAVYDLCGDGGLTYLILNEDPSLFAGKLVLVKAACGGLFEACRGEILRIDAK